MKKNVKIHKMIPLVAAGFFILTTVLSAWSDSVADTMRAPQTGSASDGGTMQLLRNDLIAASDGGERATLSFNELSERLTLKVTSDYEPAEVIYVGLQGPTPAQRAVQIEVTPRLQEGSKPPVIEVLVYADETQTTPKEVLAAMIARAESDPRIPHYIGSQFKTVAAQYAPELLGRGRGARDGADRIDEINRRLNTLHKESEALKARPETEETHKRLVEIDNEIIQLLDERGEETGTAGDGGRQVVSAAEHRRPSEAALARLMDKTTVLLVDEATVFSPDTLWELSDYLDLRESEKRLHLQVGLARFDMDRRRATAFSGKEFRAQLEILLSQYAGRPVRVTVDFEIDVDESVEDANPADVNDKVKAQTGGLGITHFVGRAEFGRKLAEVVGSLVAVFDHLSVPEGQVIAASLNDLFEEVGSGVTPASPVNVSSAQRKGVIEALRNLL